MGRVGAACGTLATLVLTALVLATPAAADVVARVGTASGVSLRFVSATATLTAQLGSPVYVLGNKTSHRLTRLRSIRRADASTTYTFATDETGRTMQLTVSRSGHGVAAAWTVLPADGVDYMVVRLAATRAQHFLGGGERRHAVDLRRRIVRLKVWNACQSNAPAPSFMSSSGYGFAVDSPSVGSVAFPGAANGPEFSCQWGTTPCPVASGVAAIQICERGATLGYRVFGGSFTQLQRDLSAVVGRPTLPPPSEFELIKWRDAVAGSADLLDDVAQLQSRGIPIGWELLDNPWETCLGSMTFSPAFPDPAGLVQTLAARGVRLMTWISPDVDPRCGADAGYTGLIPDGDLEAIDLTSPANAAEFERRLRGLLGLGVAGVKGDRGDEVDLEHTGLAAGWGQTLHNSYPVLFERLTAAAAQAAGLRSLPSIFRAGWEGSAPVVSGFWAGDQTGDVHGLRSAIRSAATAGLGGYSTWGSDIGGYISNSLDANVFVRWSQLGAISPVFEVGGDGPQSTFWQFGAATTARFKRSAILHYELFPTLYSLARDAHATGVPIIRALAFEFPNDPRAWTHDLELMVGDDLLAAPVDSDASVVSFPVYLPRGRWIDVFTGASRAGGRTVSRRTTLDDFPLYLRAGAAIPFNLRADDVWTDPWATNELEHAGRAGWLYAPGGSTSVAGFHATARGPDVTLRVIGTKAVQVLVLGRRRPAEVRIGGVHVAARGDLRGRTTGWRLRRGSMPGVLLKLAGGSRVQIRYGRG